MQLKCTTKVYHCNFNTIGDVCINILKHYEWSPIQTVQNVLLSIQQLLGEPNPGKFVTIIKTLIQRMFLRCQLVLRSEMHGSLLNIDLCSL